MAHLRPLSAMVKGRIMGRAKSVERFQTETEGGSGGANPPREKLALNRGTGWGDGGAAPPRRAAAKERRAGRGRERAQDDWGEVLFSKPRDGQQRQKTLYRRKGGRGEEVVWSERREILWRDTVARKTNWHARQSDGRKKGGREIREAGRKEAGGETQAGQAKAAALSAGDACGRSERAHAPREPDQRRRAHRRVLAPAGARRAAAAAAAAASHFQHRLGERVAAASERVL